jgi:hypothetical protein
MDDETARQTPGGVRIAVDHDFTNQTNLALTNASAQIPVGSEFEFRF